MAGAADDESAEGYSSGPEQTLLDAGFSEEQAAALVEAMRQCVEEESEPAEPEPAPKAKGKGPVNLALVFGPKKGK